MREIHSRPSLCFVLLLACLFACSPLYAHDDGHDSHQHDHASDGDHHHHSHDHHAGHAQYTPAPGTTAQELKSKIITTHHELVQAVQENRFSEVHEKMFGIRDLIAMLIPLVDASQRSRVESLSRNAATLAPLLDDAATSQDPKQIGAHLKRLDGLMKLLATQVSAQGATKP